LKLSPIWGAIKKYLKVIPEEDSLDDSEELDVSESDEDELDDEELEDV
jgi:hypothetical protein